MLKFPNIASGLFALITLPFFVNAQPSHPARVAIIAETNDVRDVVDVLTARLTTNQSVQLLERDEVARIHREQALSAANKSYLPLGKLLGADGVLAADIVQTKQSTNLTLRLVAVKPGVILSDETFGWPIDDLDRFSEFVNKRLSALVRKLTVLPTDAVPISVVRFRSPLKSAAADEIQRQLQTLVIERLTREPQLFALERRKLQAMSEEKDLGNDASAFWSGAYLLEGTIDPTGFSNDTLTLDARLTPSKGGAPLQLQIRSSRTNLATVANLLALRVVELLNTKTEASSWNPAKEAAEFFEDAKWSYHWRAYAEAKQAADSAWALGKQDLECGLLRVRSEVGDINAHLEAYQHSETTQPVSYRSKLRPDKQNGIPPVAWAASVITRGDSRVINYASIYSKPERANIDRALESLSVYLQLSQKFSASAVVAASKNNRKNPDWYNAGIEAIDTASEVLESFHFVTKLAVEEAENLADLRAEIRAVSDWITRVPAVRHSFFVEGRIANHDELNDSLITVPNIFRSILRHGAFWYERPEETLAAYRNLMQSPAFAYIHEELWSRDLQRPCVILWPTNNYLELSNVWSAFVGELVSSTNILWQMEGHALKMVGAGDGQTLGASFTNLFETMIANGDALAANPVEVLYLKWKTGQLIDQIEKLPMGGPLARQYSLDYLPKLEKLEQIYWHSTLRNLQMASAFEKQKKYLEENRPFDTFQFNQLFSSQDYTKSQAEQLLPLVQRYHSNLLVKAEQSAGVEHGTARTASTLVRFVEGRIDRILHPREMKKVLRPSNQPAQQIALEQGASVVKNAENAVATSIFEQQKQLLRENRPLKLAEITDVFLSRNYSKAQAAELLPILQNYRSNFLAKAQQNQSSYDEQAAFSARFAEIIQKRVDAILHTTETGTPSDSRPMQSSPSLATSPTSVSAVPTLSEAVTNVLTVNNFFPLPIERLAKEGVTSAHISTHQWIENRLVLGVDISVWTNNFGPGGEWLRGSTRHVSGIALFDPESSQWDVIAYPKMAESSKFRWSLNHYSTTVVQGQVWTSFDGKIQKYDKPNGRWRAAEVSDGNAYQLFSVAGKLYAADATVIFEIVDSGKSTRLLASTKRRPTASAVDTQDLGSPVLFPGPNGILRLATKHALYSWSGNDWTSNAPLPLVRQPTILPEGALFGTTYIANNATTPQVLLKLTASKRRNFSLPITLPAELTARIQPQQTRQSVGEGTWPVPPGIVVSDAAFATHGSDLYALVNHSTVQNVVSNHTIIGHNVVAKDGCHAVLAHFKPGEDTPQKRFLKFESTTGCPPLPGSTLGSPSIFGSGPGHWIVFAPQGLIFGYEYQTLGDASSGREMPCLPGIWMIDSSALK